MKLFMDSSHANGFTGDDLFSNLPVCEHIQGATRKDVLGLGIKALDKALTINSTYTTQFENKLGLLRTKNSYTIPLLPRTKPNLITGFFINSGNIEIVEDLILPELQSLLETINPPENIPEKYQYIHVRRGDYVTSATSHGLIGANHYKKFVQNDLPLIIGTDDLKSSESIIQELRPKLVFSPNNSNAWQALKMMALSESLVLANSTLSWWGGFLASNRGKVVFSPSPFYKNDLNSDELIQYKGFIKVTSEFL